MRRRAQSEFVDESLAPVEAISAAFQPPIPFDNLIYRQILGFATGV